MVNLWLFLAVAAGGLLAGCLYLLIGGLGVARTLQKRCLALETDIDDLHLKVTREIKRRAANAATEARAEIKTNKDIQEEASRRLLQDPPKPRAVPDAPGLPSMFNRG